MDCCIMSFFKIGSFSAEKCTAIFIASNPGRNKRTRNSHVPRFPLFPFFANERLIVGVLPSSPLQSSSFEGVKLSCNVSIDVCATYKWKFTQPLAQIIATPCSNIMGSSAFLLGQMEGQLRWGTTCIAWRRRRRPATEAETLKIANGGTT